jgi:hypothetical protein
MANSWKRRSTIAPPEKSLGLIWLYRDGCRIDLTRGFALKPTEDEDIVILPALARTLMRPNGTRKERSWRGIV